MAGHLPMICFLNFIFWIANFASLAQAEAQCEVPTVENGYLELTANQGRSFNLPFLSGLVSVGTELFLNCDNDYVATSPSIICQFGGQWSQNPLPTCAVAVAVISSRTPTLIVQKCPIPPITNGRLVNSQTKVVVNAGDEVNARTNLALLCDNNFIPADGVTTIRCNPNRKLNVTNIACNPRPKINSSTRITTTRSQKNTSTLVTSTRTIAITRSSQGMTSLRCGRAFRVKSLFSGKNVAEQGDQPWMALINVTFQGESVKRSCGGGLIAPGWVLTAAHCLSNSQETPIQRIDVFVGKALISRKETGEQQRFSIATFIHPSFTENDEAFHYDFALVKLNNPVNVSSLVARQICLPDPSMCSINNDDDETSTTVDGCDHVVATGWETEGSETSPYLKQSLETVVSRDNCAQASPSHEMSNSKICSMVPDSENDQICGSGGMLICRNDATGVFYMSGVASFRTRDQCGVTNSPTVYSRVCTVLPWIEQTISSN